MIRINLLPEAKRQASSGGSGQLWGVVYLLSCVAWSVVLFLVYLNFHRDLEEQNTKNDELKGQIERAKGQTENIGDVEAKIAKSKKLEEVVSGLQSARQGPARVLHELSKILSEGGGPSVPADQADSVRRGNPMMSFNQGWDARRLWIDSFEETDRKCKINGFGKTNEDIAEFLRRLNISEVFDKVTLQSTTSATDAGSGLAVVRFLLSCEVKY
jgi:type IV pilus assembly protein PilN